jgi:hypothetical protein
MSKTQKPQTCSDALVVVIFEIYYVTANLRKSVVTVDWIELDVCCVVTEDAQMVHLYQNRSTFAPLNDV